MRPAVALGPTMLRWRRRSGFSLLEVMLAAAILGSAVVVLLLVLTRAAEQGNDADDIRRLQLLASDRLSELLDSEEGNNSGRFAAPYTEWRWRYQRSTEQWKGPGDDAADVEMIRHQLEISGPGALTLPALVRFSTDVESEIDTEDAGEGSK